MVARRTAEEKNIDHLIADTEELLRGFKELKAADAAEAHDKRDHGKLEEAYGERGHSDPRPRSASSKRSSYIFVLLARYRGIVDESLARLDFR
jgi:hypothetical protein